MDIPPSELFYMVFKRVLREDMGELALDGRTLKVLFELDGKKSAGELSKSLGIEMDELARIISKLIDLKLIEPLDEAVSMMNRDFFDYLHEQLALAVGPIADVIIEDTVDEMGHTISKFPKHRAAELIDLIAQEIRNEEKRVAFQQAMLTRIKEMGD